MCSDQQVVPKTYFLPDLNKFFPNFYSSFPPIRLKFSSFQDGCCAFELTTPQLASCVPVSKIQDMYLQVVCQRLFPYWGVLNATFQMVLSPYVAQEILYNMRNSPHLKITYVHLRTNCELFSWKVSPVHKEFKYLFDRFYLISSPLVVDLDLHQWDRMNAHFQADFKRLKKTKQYRTCSLLDDDPSTQLALRDLVVKLVSQYPCSRCEATAFEA